MKKRQERILKKLINYGLVASAIFALLLAGFLLYIWRSRKKIIRQKNEISEQHDIIKIQKELVQEKQHEILDSINYAQRIQRSMLATESMLSAHLKEYFVFFQPKDIVSGDFYWAAELSNGHFALVTADSTGHGVPGAIMSMLNVACLNESVSAQGLTAPEDILNFTRKSIIRHLANDGSAEGGKDGMDASLITIDDSRHEIKYSGANNPVWIVRQRQLIELEPDRMPVGRHDRQDHSFTQTSQKLEKGDMLYTLTDGFPDQFGGPRGKKFMYRQLKEKLIEISGLPVLEQKNTLEIIFHGWKGDNEQVDDVTIIGIRI